MALTEPLCGYIMRLNDKEILKAMAGHKKFNNYKGVIK